MVVNVTKHALTRSKERLGLNRNATGRLAQKAWDNGFDAEKTVGMLFKYISEREDVNASYVKIYGENVFCFHDSMSDTGKVLLTVFPVPSEVKKQALKVAKKVG